MSFHSVIIADERRSRLEKFRETYLFIIFDSHQYTFELRLEIIVLVMYYHRNIIKLKKKKLVPSLSVIAQRIKKFHSSKRIKTESSVHFSCRGERQRGFLDQGCPFC